MRHPARLTPFLFGVISVTALTLLTISAATYLIPLTGSTVPGVSVAAGAPAQGPPPAARQVKDVIRLRIGPRGYDTTEVTRPSGPLRLVLINMSGRRELELLLSREDGEQVGKVRFNKNKIEKRETVTLGPGRYLLTDAANPAVSCRLTITEG